MKDGLAHQIELRRQDGVATLTLRRPEARNALTPAMFEHLGACFDALAEDAETRVVVLTGEGEAFSSGADLSGSPETLQRLQEGPVGRGRFARKAIEPALKLHRLPKPTLAAVNGVAAGGGCNLALGCDLVFAGESARFSQIFVNRGLALDYAGTWLLPRLVGLQRARDLAFRGAVIGAKEAFEMGLALEVVPDDSLQERVQEYARDLAARPPIALSLIKGGLNRASTWSFEDTLEWEAEAQATCLGSRDFREAMAAWMQKRPGEYQGS